MRYHNRGITAIVRRHPSEDGWQVWSRVYQGWVPAPFSGDTGWDDVVEHYQSRGVRLRYSTVDPYMLPE